MNNPGATASPALALKRLRWQCRRGMKEMDALLLRFLDTAYADADPLIQAGFEQLLLTEDDQLWRWLSGRLRPDQLHLAQVIDAIHATAH